ncbi:DgyrCDS5191 [Dimorphilus gyrociliatus]|uniref:DgyrCDS5191 n=1 Tax=Dimorphilus gyrociliatus TaxID=2664684 RepID=A0A7I8VJ87_9ANNE|nr:DgyrCDS5191 [Dimorphilus gyrociliatus]
MEFPELGENCSEATCKQLDFLPMKCDACSRMFCKDHLTYATHNCPESYKRNRQVPICPLCNSAITVSGNASVDMIVNQHIDNDCCKIKELMSLTCSKCRLNFCLKHRHEADHDCQGPQIPTRTNKSVFKNQNVQLTNGVESRRPMAVSLQPQNISEDEAMARALQASMAESNAPGRTLSDKELQEQRDFELAKALQMEADAGNRPQQTNTRQRETRNSNCQIS